MCKHILLKTICGGGRLQIRTCWLTNPNCLSGKSAFFIPRWQYSFGFVLILEQISVQKDMCTKKNYRMIKINCEEGRIDFEQGLIWKLCFAGSYFLLMLRLLLLLPRLPITSCNFPQHHQNQPYSLSLIFSLTLLASSSLSA